MVGSGGRYQPGRCFRPYYDFVTLAVLLACYVAAAVYLVLCRSGPSAAAYRGGGELGFLLFVYRTLLFDGFAKLTGRNLAAAPIDELGATVEGLQAELADLRGAPNEIYRPRLAG